MQQILKDIFYPFGKPNKAIKIGLLVAQIVLLCIYLETHKSPIIPAPTDIFKTFVEFLSSTAFYDDFFATFMFVMKGMGYAMLITMTLTYLRPISFFTPLVDFITKCRYLTFSTVIIMFTYMVQGGNVNDLKMLLLLFGTVPFFVNSFVAETKIGLGIPQYHLDKAYVNKKNQWEALLEIVVIGKVDRLFEVVRQNFAIAWAVITTVEANAMNEGGIGTMITKANKHVVMGQLMAIALIVILIGVFFDFIYGFMRTSIFPYVKSKK